MDKRDEMLCNMMKTAKEMQSTLSEIMNEKEFSADRKLGSFFKGMHANAVCAEIVAFDLMSCMEPQHIFLEKCDD